MLLVRLPRIDVRLSDSPPGREIGAYLCERARGIYFNRVAQGILDIPGRPADYLRGRSRQAVRTNLHRADDAHLTCNAVHDRAERRSAAIAFGMGESQSLIIRASDLFWVACNPDNENVGALWATVDTEWAMLRFLVANCSEARYALHTTLVNYLSTKGVRYLFAESASALLLTPGLQYFQKLLGYRVAHLRVRRSA